VLKSAWRLGQVDAETYQRAIDVKAVLGSTLPAGRSLTSGELTALMSVCAEDQTSAGIRDGAMIAMLYTCGLRRAEIVSLDVGDYDQVNGALKVTGKRNKQRLTYVMNGAADALADWLTVRGDTPGALFWAIRRGGHVQVGHRMTPQAVWNVIAKRAAEAGLSEDISPHDFRRTFISDLLDAGADISTVQRLAGHANVTTTQRYDRRPESTKRQAAQLLHVPYRRRTLQEARRA